MNQMNELLYLMEERKQMVEDLLERCHELLKVNRELQIKYLALLIYTKSIDKSE